MWHAATDELEEVLAPEDGGFDDRVVRNLPAGRRENSLEDRDGSDVSPRQLIREPVSIGGLAWPEALGR